MRNGHFRHPASNRSLARPARLSPPPAAPIEGDATQAEVFAELGVALAAFLGVALLAGLVARLLGAA